MCQRADLGQGQVGKIRERGYAHYHCLSLVPRRCFVLERSPDTAIQGFTLIELMLTVVGKCARAILRYLVVIFRTDISVASRFGFGMHIYDIRTQWQSVYSKVHCDFPFGAVLSIHTLRSASPQS